MVTEVSTIEECLQMKLDYIRLGLLLEIIEFKSYLVERDMLASGLSYDYSKLREYASTIKNSGKMAPLLE